MTPAHQHQQRGGQRRVGEPIAAANAAHAFVDHDKFHAGRHSSRRPNCRGFTASALSFTPRSMDLDEILELRICELTGRQPVLARAQSIPNQPLAERPVGSEISVQFEATLHHEKHRDRETLEPCSQNRGRASPR